jgi:hypothetical protein
MLDPRAQTKYQEKGMMKRTAVFSVIFLMFCSIPLFAGNSELGFKAGGGVGWATGSDWDSFLASASADNRVKFNYSLGLYLDLALARWISVQPELLISGIGGAYRYDDVLGEVKGTLSATALEIPLYLKPKLSTRSGAVYLFVGPDFFLLLGDVTEKMKLDGVDAGEIGVSPDNSFLIGIAGGLGVKIRSLVLEVKYNKTFTEIFDNVNWSFNGVVFLIGAGYPIGGP